jgi:RimJ/RimL family protein N-acetyltransferase
MTTLVTDRLVLRVPEPSDLDGIAPAFTDPHAMRFYPRTYLPEEVAEWIEVWRDEWADGGFTWFAVVERATEQTIGRIGLHRLDERDDVEVGWNLRRDAWGRGLATEAASACLRWGFQDLKLDEIVAITTDENTPSQRVMDKLGMTQRGYIDYHGYHQRFYVITRAEWERAHP